MKKIAVKSLIVLIATLMVLVLLPACKNSSNLPNQTSAGGEEGSGPPKDQYDKNGYLLDHLPDDLGKLWEDKGLDSEVKILCWNAENPEFEVKLSDTSSNIDRSIYTRNKQVETRLNIELSYQQEDWDNHLVTVQNAQKGGIWWDIVATKTQSASYLTGGGCLQPINQAKGSYLDLDMPWWSQQLVDKIRINDRLYFCTGDLSTNLVQMIYCVYFNETMVNSIDGMASPYALVAQNEWTLDTMLSMAKEAYVDQDDATGVSVGDSLGLLGYSWDYPALLHGCGVVVIEQDEAGDLVVSRDFKGQKADDIIDSITDTLKLCGKVMDDDGAYGNCFPNGRSLFVIRECGSAMRYFKNVSFTAGCVPCPKYSSDQESYYSTVRQPVTMYGLVSNLPEERLEVATGVLEALSSAGYRTTTPVIFEESMMYTNSTSAQMTEMLQLIKDTAYFDFGRIYSREMKGISDWPGLCMNKGTKWQTYLARDLRTVEVLLSIFVEEHFPS